MTEKITIETRVDLHLHSSYSDGTDAPGEIVRKAKSIGLETIALTDHDTIEGWDEFSDAGDNSGIRTIPGIELSLKDIDGATEVHLLGYFPKNSGSAAIELRKYSLSRIQARKRRLSRMVTLLRDCDLEISEEEVLQETSGGKSDEKVISRVHVARALYRLNQGKFKDVRDVFEKYLVSGRKAYVPTEERLSLKQAISLVKSLDGVAILAHPGVSNDPQQDPIRGERILLMALESGADGGEGNYLYHKNNPYRDADQSITPFLCQHYIKILTQRGKIATSGSDYHGQNKEIEIGEQVNRMYNAKLFFLRR